MTTQTDKDDWERFVQTIKPLKGKADRYVDSVPPRLIVRKAPPKTLLYELDLHGATVEEAYQMVKRFFALHCQNESRQITIITGKGLKGTGKIKNEIMLWLETPVFKDNIRETHWLNDGGVIRITLKRKKKKNEQRKIGIGY